nr:STN domain-containing protein [uncultured Pseudomonas sp.]
MRQVAALIFCIVLGIIRLTGTDPFEPPEEQAHDGTAVSLVTFVVLAGDLSGALLHFAEQANLSLAFAPGLARGKTTKGILGTHSTLHALAMLAKSLGLQVISIPGSRYRLEPLA